MITRKQKARKIIKENRTNISRKQNNNNKREMKTRNDDLMNELIREERI